MPRVFIENGSKVVKSHISNDIGAIITYTGTKPSFEISQCVPPEMYQHLERMVNYAYQQSGISALAAAAQKPAGLNSGEAIRSYDDLQTDRFAATVKQYDLSHVSLAHKVFDLAKEIAERDGKYSTVYPSKDGTKRVDLPNISLVEDAYVIQCFDSSSLPKEPAGRLQKITEMIQSGMIDIKEGRRLLDFPDLEQIEKLANAGEERIYKILDEIVEKGKYTPPDPFLDPQTAMTIAIQYYNLYIAANLEEKKAEKLRTFILQCQDLLTQAQQPSPAMQQPQPLAAPMPRPQSDLVPNVPAQGQPQ